MDIRNAITIDVEEWFDTMILEKHRKKYEGITSLPQDIKNIMTFLRRYKTKATFFILGSVAKRYLGLVRSIVCEGHEIASHGFNHRSIYKISLQEFQEDLRLSLEILRETSGSEILGYRAPTWSLKEDMSWAIKNLRDMGLKYDSSIYPFSGACDKEKKYPFKLQEDFIEFPPSVFKFCGRYFPFCGGFFLRLFPMNFIGAKILEINRLGYPAMLYFHSWEFNGYPRKTDLPAWKKLIQYGNIKSVRSKLEFFLENFLFSSVKEVLDIKYG